jgi:L-amino acid N-acyltransferase YncA
LRDSSLEIPVEGLSDGIIRLRLKADADLPAVVEACSEPEIARWTRVPEHYTTEDGRTWFAVRAVRLPARFAFETLGFERVQIEVGPHNQASRQVPERAGFTEEGLLRAYILIKGTQRDVIMYSLLRGELG